MRVVMHLRLEDLVRITALRMNVIGLLAVALSFPAASVAHAGPDGIRCGSASPPGGSISSVCVSVISGRVHGYAFYFGSGPPTDESIFLAACNAAGTSCGVVPGSSEASLLTPALPATAGVYYETCASWQVGAFPQPIQYYNECSPLETS